MKTLMVAGLAFLGGLCSALLGWADSKDPTTGKLEPFNSRKFLKSIGVSLITALVFAITYQFVNGLVAQDFIVSFLTGMGVEAGSNRAILGKVLK